MKSKNTPLARWLLQKGVKGKDLAKAIRVHPSVISRAKKGVCSEETRARLQRETGLKKL
jgi:hypothetical protein